MTSNLLLVAAVAALAAAVALTLHALMRRTPTRGGTAPSLGPPPHTFDSQRPLLSVPSAPGLDDELDDWDVTQIQVLPLATSDVDAETSQTSDPSPAQSAFAHELDEPEGAEGSNLVILYEAGAEEEEGTAPVARILIHAEGDSDRGNKRRANEDSFLCLSEQALFAVADGMGGYAGGKVASNLAVDTLRTVFERGVFEGRVRSDKPVHPRGQELACAVLSANDAVFKASRADARLANMGTTAVVARFSANKQRLYLAHVGDSRCYRFRAGRLRQLTTDHTMSLFGMSGPRAKDLCRAVGVNPHIDIDLIVDKPRGDDVYLLCSDGLPKMVSDAKMQDILSQQPDLEAAVYDLIEAANDNGGKDNVTVVLVQVIERAAAVLQPPKQARTGSKLQ